jgi:hypothetical protein
MTEWTPQELLPIIPPSVQWLWVAGSGPKVRPCRQACRRSVSSTQPGCTRARRLPGSSSSTRPTCFDQSTTTATLQVCPARPVPPPRESTGAPWRRQAATVSTTSSTVRGTTTPIGTWR